MGKQSRKLPPTIARAGNRGKARPEQDSFKQRLLDIQLINNSDSDSNDFQAEGADIKGKRRAKAGHFKSNKKKNKGASEANSAAFSPAANPTEFLTHGVSIYQHINWWQKYYQASELIPGNSFY
jgi:hypothetical protein